MEEKNFDGLDYTLFAGFLVVLITICVMALMGKEVPGLLETIFTSLVASIGLKKAPSVIG